MTASENPPRPPRVLHFITHLALGGAERVAFDLVRGLRGEFESAIYAVQGVADDAIGRAMRTELAENNVPLFIGTRWPLKFGGLVLAGTSAAKALREFQPDLVHLHTEIPEASYAVMVTLQPSLAAIPVVRTVHHASYWQHWQALGRWSERRMRASTMAAVSADAGRAYERHRASVGLLPPGQAPTVIYNGVAAPATQRQPNSAEAQALRVLFAGRLEKSKGADLLPAILPLVALPAGSRAEISILGHGKFEGRLREFAARPPAGWTVRLQPPVANLAARIHEYDLLLVPSRVEGLGLIAIEAALAGVPVVATDAPGLREALPASHPWIARAGDARSFAQMVQRAMAERATWPEVCSRAMEFARQRFAPLNMNTAYARLYAQALKRN